MKTILTSVWLSSLTSFTIFNYYHNPIGMGVAWIVLAISASAILIRGDYNRTTYKRTN